MSTTGFIEHGKLIEYPSEDTSELYYGTITEPILETLAQLNHKQWANQKPILIPPVADISQPMQILTEPHTPTVFKMPKFDHNDNSTVIPPAYQAQLKPARGQQHRRRPNRFPQGRARMSHQKCSINSGNFFVGRCGPVESRSNIGDYGLAKDLRATLTKGHRALVICRFSHFSGSLLSCVFLFYLFI